MRSRGNALARASRVGLTTLASGRVSRWDEEYVPRCRSPDPRRRPRHRTGTAARRSARPALVREAADRKPRPHPCGPRRLLSCPGADVGTSASYQARRSSASCAAASKPKHAAELMRLSVRRSSRKPQREPRRLRTSAAGGGVDRLLRSFSGGRIGISRRLRSRRGRARRLASAAAGDADRSGKPDLLACETIPCLAEVEALAPPRRRIRGPRVDRLHLPG